MSAFTRIPVILALAATGALTGVIVASAGSSSGGGTQTTSGTAGTAATTPPVVAPAIPCSSSGGQSTAPKTSTPITTPTTSTQSTTPTTANTTWTGVFERVTAHLENDGSVKKAPRQFTRVTAEGNGPVTVRVPMSDKGLHPRGRGRKPSVSSGVAQIDLDPSGTKTRQFDSDFAGSLPVAVKVSFKLNGKAVSLKDVKHKSGTVEVDYQLDNTTSKPVTVCFKGFNGAVTKQTVSTPVPLIAYLSFTVPSNASTFHASGASLAPAKKGISVSWTSAMFPPLGQTTQTFTLTMDTSKAEIPKAHLLLETLNPLAPTGEVPQKSAAAVGRAAAAADSATAKVQSDIAALQVRASQPKQPRRSSRGSGGSKSGGPSLGGSTSSSSLSFGTPTSALTTMQSQITELGQANLAFTASVNEPTRRLLGTTRTSIGGLADSTRRSIDSSTTNVNRAVDRLNRSIDRSLGGFTRNVGEAVAALKVDLRQATGPSLKTIAASAARLQLTTNQIKGHTDALAAEVAPVAAQVDGLVTQVQAPVQTSTGLVQHLAQVKADLDALNGADKTDPTFLKLVADVAAAQQVATTVNSELIDLQQRAQDVAQGVHTLQTDVLSLQNEITALAAAVAANAEGAVEGRLATALAGVAGRVAKAEATAAGSIAKAQTKAARAVHGHAQNAKQSIASARASARQTLSSAETNAQRRVTSAIRQARQSVQSTERSVSDTLTSVQAKANQALASAKEKARQGGQASLAAAQASAAKAAGAVGDAVDKANADYARLLTTNEVAFANQLPGGDAVGVTEQNGSFRYVIEGS